ncbi:GNAT family N-acetyltransferase [Euzebya tangerina]|uniref:GNAT family N-acetyltransferase n=1 Tax=Euzebya tangerina TaxID=591198 RepID=UPI000E315CA3|nr:GNAT family protein [Euzebya tangerina]
MDTFFAPERFEADGFVLRGYRPGDGEALADAVTSSYEHLAPWMSWASKDQSVEESEGLSRSFRADYLRNTDFVLGIWTPDESRLLGGTGYHLRGKPMDHKVAEIGMWIRADAAGAGLGTGVLRTLLEWGFDEWPWHRLSWLCDSDNHASRRTAEKAGMRHEGTLRGEKAEVGDGHRDTLVFGLVRNDPR